MSDSEGDGEGASRLEKFKKSRSPEYGEKGYWEDRYSATNRSDYYDWYQDYDSCSELKALLNQHIPKDNRILVVGCGNSRLSEQMYQDGYKKIVSIDFARPAIEIMKRRAQSMNFTELEYLEMDARSMSLEDGSFDAAIDKGTIDAMMCGKDNLTNVDKLCTEVTRVLKPDGIFIVITYGKPDSRLEHLDKPQYGWTVKYTTVSKPNEDNVHHVYYMKKNG